MEKARLIKKTNLAERGSATATTQKPYRSQQSVSSATQKTLTQWVGAYRNARCPDPRVAFAALFIAEA